MKADDRVAVTRWWNALWVPSKALGKHPPCVAGLRRGSATVADMRLYPREALGSRATGVGRGLTDQKTLLSCCAPAFAAGWV